MASPAFTGLDRYGPTAWSSGGDWATSRTLSAPSFSAATCLVAIVYDYVNNNSLGTLSHWDVPSSWTYLGLGGSALSGGTNTAHVGTAVYQAAPSDIAGAVLRPEKADNTLFTPSASATFNYWRVFVTGWTPAKIASVTGTGNSSETRSVVPFNPASPFITGTNEGTWVQFTCGGFAYNGGPTAVSTANGFTQEFSIGTHPQFQLASKAFASSGSTDACVYSKPTSAFALAGTIAVALDTPVSVPLDRCSTVTFTPGSVVPQGSDGAVIYSSGALDSFGTDNTPPGWPTTGAKVKAIEVEVTSTSEFTADGQIQAVVCRPDTLTGPIPGATSDASGTWSGWDGGVGQYRSSGVDAYYLNKIGGWRTDYLTPDLGQSSVNDLSTPDRADLRVTGIDLRARVRLADWDAAASDRRTIAARYSGAGTGSWIWAVTGSEFYFMVHRGSDVEYVGTCAQSLIGVVDGEWADLRVTYDNTNRMRWYDVNGNLVETDNVTGMTTIHPGSAPLRLGNNRSAGGRSAGGLGGDIEWFEMRDAAGTLIQTLSVDAMDSSGDTGWTPSTGSSWSRDSGVGVTGASIPATQRVRWVADTPFPVEDVRLIVDAQTGSLTVDEVLIEAECGRTFGVYRDGRLHAT